jgi:hypothetical protein
VTTYNKTEWVYLDGKAYWVQAHKPNQWGKWSMQFYPTQKSLDFLRELIAEKGIKTQIKKDDDGWFIRVSKPTQLTLKTGKIVGMTQPELFNGNLPIMEGDKIVGYAPLTEPVGNGSDGVLKLDMYSYTIPASGGKKGWALRWNSLRVDNLVPFNKGSIDSRTAHAAEGLNEQPKQAAW